MIRRRNRALDDPMTILHRYYRFRAKAQSQPGIQLNVPIFLFEIEEQYGGLSLSNEGHETEKQKEKGRPISNGHRLFCAIPDAAVVTI
jgi:hypothetical protein